MKLDALPTAPQPEGNSPALVSSSSLCRCLTPESTVTPDSTTTKTVAAPALKDTQTNLLLDAETVEDIFRYACFAFIAGVRSIEEAIKQLSSYDPRLAAEVVGFAVVTDGNDSLVGRLKVDSEVNVLLLQSGEVVLSFRGTDYLFVEGKIQDKGIRDIVADILSSQTPVSQIPGLDVKPHSTVTKVHTGFLKYFNSLIDPSVGEGDIKSAVEELVVQQQAVQPEFKLTRITFAGHSLGGAVAALGAYWSRTTAFKETPVACYTFGSPKLGNAAFAADFNTVVTTCYLVVHRDDAVSSAPITLTGRFRHVGAPALLCQPGTKAYSLSKSVQALYQDQKTRYAAAAVERNGFFFNIQDHRAPSYIAALRDILSNGAGTTS